MSFISGNEGIMQFSIVPLMGGSQFLEMVLRPAGRYIVKEDEAFLALSDAKPKTQSIAGTPTASMRWNMYDANPTVLEFAKSDIFTSELLEQSKVDKLELYGIMVLPGGAMSNEGGVENRIQGMISQFWYSKLPIQAWDDNDCIKGQFLVSSVSPMGGANEGIRASTVQVKSMPAFAPIKSWMDIGINDKVYIYSRTNSYGYCGAGTPGAIIGNTTQSVKLIVGKGFLAETVEEILCPAQ